MRRLERLMVLVYQAPLWSLLVIVVVGGLAYSNTLVAPFVFDDIHAIVTNGEIRRLPPTAAEWFHQRSLPHVTFTLNYLAGGYNVFGYHLVNIAIHLLAAWVVFWLSFLLASQAVASLVVARFRSVRLTNHLVIALVAALIFVVHPVQAQAVTYIVQRLSSLTALLYVLALATYVKFRTSPAAAVRVLWAAASLSAAVLAMHSKEISITIPAAIVLLEVMFFSSSWQRFKRRIPFLIPWLLTFFIIPFYLLGGVQLLRGQLSGEQFVAGLTPSGAIGAAAETRTIPRATYLLTQFNVIRTYLRLLVLPIRQNIDYDYPLSYTLFDLRTALSLLLIISLLAAAVVLWRKTYRICSFGILFFFLTLLPESSVVPITDVIFEHRLYLPLVGVALIAAYLITIMLAYARAHTLWKAISAAHLAAAVSVLLIVALAAATYARNAVWRDAIGLWQDAVSKSPYKARVHKSLGDAYMDGKQYQEAKTELARALALDPRYEGVHENLGVIYSQEGNFQQALAEFEQELALYPDNLGARNNVALMYLAQDRLPQAAVVYQELFKLRPSQAEWHSNLGVVYRRQGLLERAIGEFEQALVYDPSYVAAYINLGNVLRQQGRFGEARAAYAKAIEIDPNNTVAQRGLHLVD